MSTEVKVIALLWSRDGARMCDALLAEVAPQLSAIPGLTALQLNLDDISVAPAAARKIETGWVLCQALCSFIVSQPSITVDAIGLLRPVCEALSFYPVEVREPLPAAISAPGTRSPGFSQIAFISRPSTMTVEDWFRYWRETHAPIAMETQSTWRYVQNRLLPEAAEGANFDAIVEECFPAAAMTDDDAFYAAPGDPALRRRRQREMMESCSRFIDFTRIAVLPTSEYRF